MSDHKCLSATAEFPTYSAEARVATRIPTQRDRVERVYEEILDQYSARITYPGLFRLEEYDEHQILFQDHDALTPVTSIGQEVRAFRSLETGEVYAYQVPDERPPKWGGPAVGLFFGEFDYLRIPADLSEVVGELIVEHDSTRFCSLVRSSPTERVTIWGFWGDSDDLRLKWESGANIGYHGDVIGGTDTWVRNRQSSIPFPAGEQFVAAVRSGPNVDEWRLWTDDATASTTWRDFGSADVPDGAEIFIGSRNVNDSPDRSWIGPMGELLVMHDAVSDQERHDIASLLRSVEQ